MLKINNIFSGGIYMKLKAAALLTAISVFFISSVPGFMTGSAYGADLTENENETQIISSDNSKGYYFKSNTEPIISLFSDFSSEDIFYDKVYKEAYSKINSKKFYNIILEALYEKKTEIDIHELDIPMYNPNSSDSEYKSTINKYITNIFWDTYFNIIYSNPELFYIRTSANFSMSGYKGDETVTISSILPVYIESYKDEASAEKFETAGNAIVNKLISEEMTDAEKALVLHDYLAKNISYDTEAAQTASVENSADDIKSAYTAYGALIENEAVCQGYALAYMYLLDKVGVNSVLVTSDAMGHA